MTFDAFKILLLPYYERDDEMYFQAIEYKSDLEKNWLSLLLKIIIVPEEGGPSVIKLFVFHFTGIIDFRISVGAWSIDIYDQHPLLLNHLNPKGILFFRGTAMNMDFVLLDLWRAHYSIFGDWIPFGSPDEYYTLLKGGYGKLTEGHWSMIKSFADVLHKHGVIPNPVETTTSNSILNSHTLTHASVSMAPRVCIMGKSYVIFKELEITETEVPPDK